jgi:hypothetical protein
VQETIVKRRSVVPWPGAIPAGRYLMLDTHTMLLRNLRDARWEVRAAAAYGLARLSQSGGNKAAFLATAVVPALAAMLHDSMDDSATDVKADQQHLGGREFESHAPARPDAGKQAPPRSMQALEAELESTLQPPDDAAGLQVRRRRLERSCREGGAVVSGACDGLYGDLVIWLYGL